MFPNWKRDAPSKVTPSAAAASEAQPPKSDAGCCGGKAKSDATKPTEATAPQPAKKKGGCCV